MGKLRHGVLSSPIEGRQSHSQSSSKGGALQCCFSGPSTVLRGPKKGLLPSWAVHGHALCPQGHSPACAIHAYTPMHTARCPHASHLRRHPPANP